MILYLVTRSLHYYPDAGTGDWLLLTSDEAEARAKFEEAKRHERMGAAVYLIRIVGRSPGFPCEWDELAVWDR